MSRILIATDAWEPQVNGVVRTLKKTIELLEKKGHEVEVIHPGLFRTFKAPFTIDVELATNCRPSRVQKTIKRGDRIHVSTEGPIGWAYVRYCRKKNIPFTTCYHTNFPEYMKKHAYVPMWLSKWYVRQFHKGSAGLMVATHTLKKKLNSWGFTAPKKIWSRGVDLNLFYPREKTIQSDKPIALYVGRISTEKNITAFLNLDNDIEKWVVGDGPILNALKRTYPDVHFTGALHGEALAQMYANADVFVFPSKTDTFGLVVIEAMASGVPVAAYPVEGPADILQGWEGIAGVVSENLGEAVDGALKCSAKDCRELAEKFSWQSSADQFFNNLVPFT